MILHVCQVCDIQNLYDCIRVQSIQFVYLFEKLTEILTK